MSIVLKNIDLTDAPKIAAWKSDPLLSKKIMSAFKKTSIDEATVWITKNTADVNQKLNGIYYTNDNSNCLIGITRLMFIDWKSKVAEFGIYIGDSDYTGKGLGATALDLTIDQAFVQLGLRKIFLRVAESNENALHLYLKKGFEIEGTLQEHIKVDQHFENLHIMSKFNSLTK